MEEESGKDRVDYATHPLKGGERSLQDEPSGWQLSGQVGRNGSSHRPTEHHDTICVPYLLHKKSMTGYCVQMKAFFRWPPFAPTIPPVFQEQNGKTLPEQALRQGSSIADVPRVSVEEKDGRSRSR